MERTQQLDFANQHCTCRRTWSVSQRCVCVCVCVCVCNCKLRFMCVCKGVDINTQHQYNLGPSAVSIVHRQLALSDANVKIRYRCYDVNSAKASTARQADSSCFRTSGMGTGWKRNRCSRRGKMKALDGYDAHMWMSLSSMYQQCIAVISCHLAYVFYLF